MELPSAIRFFSVGLALAAALAVGKLMEGFWPWLVECFLATVVYVTVFAFELAVARRVKQSRQTE